MLTFWYMDDNDKDELIFDLREEINRLRGQVTYLQNELSSVEDDLNACRAINTALEHPPDRRWPFVHLTL